MSISDQLKRLADLYSSGALTDAEYQEAKRQVLGMGDDHLTLDPEDEGDGELDVLEPLESEQSTRRRNLARKAKRAQASRRLRECKDCGHSISSRSKACPQCGAPFGGRTSPAAWGCLAIMGLCGLLPIVWGLFSPSVEKSAYRPVERSAYRPVERSGRTGANKYASLVRGVPVARGGSEERAMQRRFDRLKLFIKEQDDEEVADLLVKSVQMAQSQGLSWSYETALYASTASFPPEAEGEHLLSLAEVLAALLTLAGK